jgi:ferritin-like metal-binding protein YciE
MRDRRRTVGFMVRQLLQSPLDLLQFQLKTAMTMEDDSLAALGELAKAARSADIKKMFRHHADETKEQIENLRSVFGLLELREATAASPSTKGISRQAGSLIERSAPKLRDQVVLASALGNEHYEIAAYRSLIAGAMGLGLTEAVGLLTANLDQETHTSEELESTLRKLVDA